MSVAAAAAAHIVYYAMSRAIQYSCVIFYFIFKIDLGMESLFFNIDPISFSLLLVFSVSVLFVLASSSSQPYN